MLKGGGNQMILESVRGLRINQYSLQSSKKDVRKLPQICEGFVVVEQHKQQCLSDWIQAL